MSSSNLTTDDGYQSLLGRISQVYTTGQARAVQAVNVHITETYWLIGRNIVEFEQGGNVRADYGTGLLDRLSRDLSARHGKGFSRSNVVRIRQFYLAFPKGATLSHQLSWSHIVELLKVEDPLERSFYEQQSIREKWAVRELKRQRESSLFLRLAAGKDKDAILQLATQGRIVSEPADLLRDPYVFEFLKIPEPHHLTESDLETRLCDHLQPFLLELGKGFTFVGRQYRITLNNTHYRVDLVFYHRILRWCRPVDGNGLCRLEGPAPRDHPRPSLRPRQGARPRDSRAIPLQPSWRQQDGSDKGNSRPLCSNQNADAQPSYSGSSSYPHLLDDELR